MMITKRLLLLFATALVLSTFSSCLDENTKGLLPEEKAYNSTTNLYINTVATLYNYIGGNSDSQGLEGTVRGLYDYNTFSTDEAIIPIRGGDWYDGGFWQNLYEHRWTASDEALYNTWLYLYKVAMLCNHSLAVIDANRSLLTDKDYLAYTSEVKAVRCLFYYELMDMFGRIPYVTQDQEAFTNVSQQERSTVFHNIIDELQSCLPYLANEHSNLEGNYYGRMTRPVAQFLLARLFLNAEVYADDDWTDKQHPDGKTMTFTVDGLTMNAWQACVHYCDEIEKEGYQLQSDYAFNFSVHNETSVENIFTIPMDKIKYQNQFWYLYRSRHYAHGGAIGMDAENGTSATLATVHAYGYGTDSLDTRFAINFYADTVKVDGKVVTQESGEPLVYQPLVMAENLTYSPYEKTAGARMAKYEIDRKAYADGKLQDNDIVLFRFADVLLMRAEAKVRNGENGQSDLDAVRRRVGMPCRPATLDNILRERLLELMWEGNRRRDLIRYGLFHKAYDLRQPIESESDAHTIVFPIPTKAIDLNNKLTQNKGYKTEK